MNAKAVRLARQVNRIAGKLEKRRIPLDAFETHQREVVLAGYKERGETAPPEAPPKPHRVLRVVKRWWSKLNHQTRGQATKHWRHAVQAGAIE